MTIKDIERLTGISKANIRFYETEGLIAPERSSNGYRTYNESHVAQLKRIRLLRALDIPIETIKEIIDGRVSLRDALNDHKTHFAQQYSQLELLEMVIGQMLAAEESYETLDVDTYLGLLEDGNGVPAQDVNSRLNNPWRRFWARTLDFSLYNLLLYLLIPGLFAGGIMTGLRLLADIVLFIAAETLMLAWFKTTPGKAVFGITVTSLEGQRLTFKQALDRTFLVLQHGLGFNIPFLSQYFQWRSLKTVEAGQELPWECETEVNFRDEKNWRYLLAAVLMVPMLVYPVLGGVELELPEQEPRYPGTSPLIYDYRVEEVLFSANEAEEIPLVHFSNDKLYFCWNGSTPRGSNPDGMELVGEFQYTPPADDPEAGVWELYIDSASEKMYQLRIEPDESVVLEYYESMQLQWSWKLSRVDTLDIRIQNEYTTLYLTPEWYASGAFDGDISNLATAKIHDDSTVTLIFTQEKPEEITIVEEVHQGNDVITRERTAAADEYGMLKFEISPVESGQECYSIFRIPYDGGEYIVCITYENG